MDYYLIYYSILAVINIGLLLVFITEIILSKKIAYVIGISLIGLISILFMLSPIKSEIGNLNDCVAFYSYYKYPVIKNNYEFNFLKRCDFNESQIKNMMNYSDIPINLYPESGDWNKPLNNTQWEKLNWSDLQ
jgi:hypothetical protein